VLELVAGQVILFIEVKKGAQGPYPGLEAEIVKIIRAHQAEAWVRILSFDNRILQTFMSLAPDLRYQKLLVGQLPGLALYMDGTWHGQWVWEMDTVETINVNSRFATRRFIRKVQEAGKTIQVWTVDDPENMKKLIQKGVDGIITNRPDLAQRDLLGSSNP
ncbi:MAG: glycerophosphodiester phosphodiesterase, partial [Bacteroidota bacterium]